MFTILPLFTQTHILNPRTMTSAHPVSRKHTSTFLSYLALSFLSLETTQKKSMCMSKVRNNPSTHPFVHCLAVFHPVAHLNPNSKQTHEHIKACNNVICFCLLLVVIHRAVCFDTKYTPEKYTKTCFSSLWHVNSPYPAQWQSAICHIYKFLCHEL